MAAIEFRGLNAVTNFDRSRYIEWLRPNQTNTTNANNIQPNPNPDVDIDVIPIHSPNQDLGLSFLQQESSSSVGTSVVGTNLSLLQSSKFNEMLERTSAVNCPSTPPESDPPRRSFPDDIQTYFASHDSGSYADVDDIMFGDLNSFASPLFQCELDE